MRIRRQLVALLTGVLSLGAVVAMIPSGGASAERPELRPRGFVVAEDGNRSMTCAKAKELGLPEAAIRKHCSS